MSQNVNMKLHFFKFENDVNATFLYKSYRRTDETSHFTLLWYDLPSC